MNPHFALIDLEQEWQWIGRHPITDEQGKAVAMARCNHGPAVLCLRTALKELDELRARCDAHARIEEAA